MQKAATTIILFSSASNLTEEPKALQTPPSILSKTKQGEVMAKSICLVHQEMFLSKQHLWSQQQRHCGAAQTVLLSKKVRTAVTGRQRDTQTIEALGAYTLLRWFSTRTTNNTHWAKEATWMASAFLGKYASIAADVIQWKKLDFRDFFMLTEARFEII